MIGHDDVIRLAREEGLGDHADTLAGTVRPGWRLDLDRGGDPARPGATKIGGDPDLAAAEEWPVNPRGIGLTFLAQVDCSALPPIESTGWRHDDRLIRVFADLLDNPFEPGPALVLGCDARAPLIRTPPPALPVAWPPRRDSYEHSPGERVAGLPEAAVSPRPFLTAPETHPTLKTDHWDFSEAAERYTRWTHRLRIDGRPIGDTSPAPWEVHQMLGEPCSIQDDVRGMGALVRGQDDPALDDEDAWRVLLELHDDERIGLEILDGGAYTVLAPAADLASGRHERLVCSVDSG